MIRAVKMFFVLAAMTPSVAYAQLDIGVDLAKFGDTLEQLCPVADNFNLGAEVSGALTWVCGMRPTIDRASELVENLSGDLNGFFEDGLYETFAVIADATGMDIGDTNLRALLADAGDTISTGAFSMSGLAGQLVAQVNQQTFKNLTAPPDPGAGPLETSIVNSIRSDPGQLAKELEAMGMRTDEVMRNAKSQDLSNSARILAASSLARGDEEQLMKRVTNPNPLDLAGKGTADKAQDLGTNAVSTRAAVQALVDAQANEMRQNALSTANLVTAIKEQALQQTFTTQQLSLLEQSLSNDALREYNKWQDDYYDKVAQNAAAAEEVRANYQALGEMLTDMGDRE